MPQDTQDPRTAGALYKLALQPGSARGYQSQFYGPFMLLNAKMAGFDPNALRRLSVSCTWAASSSHSCRGKAVSVVANIDMNTSLNIWMASLATFTGWLCSSTSYNLHFFLVRNCLMYFVAWLSITFTFGLYPLASNILKWALYALKYLCCPGWHWGCQWANIALVLLWYIARKQTLPSRDMNGKCPIKLL